MKVLVVGGGGREHAICWRLARSPEVEKIWCAPGNAGIAKCAELVGIQGEDVKRLADFAEQNSAGLTVAGPEAPLCAGIADEFKKRGLRIFGPDMAAARLEGSKTFAKDFMRRHGIPTAEAEAFTDCRKAVEYVRSRFAAGEKGVVIKADGLAAGKGVLVSEDAVEAERFVTECFGGTFGEAGRRVLVEEMLVGEEASILALTDGKTILPLASSQDHKRLMDGDRGPNTGGMGAYSPAPVVDDALWKKIDAEVLQNFLKGVQKDGLHYRGVIYAGIMATDKGPKVLEFNVRFGDPETQAVLARLDSDLCDAMVKTADGRLSDVSLKWRPGAAVCVAMVSGGYPGSYGKGFPISGLDEAEKTGAIVFHAGTAAKDGKIVSSGGRVLGVTALGESVGEAARNAYMAVDKISWQDAFHRRDIAHRAIGRGK